MALSYLMSFIIFWKSHTVSNYREILTSQMLISTNTMDRFMEHVYAPLLNRPFFADRVWYDTARVPTKKVVFRPKPAAPTPKSTATEKATADLLKAVSNGDVSGVKSALDRGGIVWATYRGRNTLLHENARQGNVEIGALLLQHGLSLSATNSKGLTPRDVARHHHHTKLADAFTSAAAAQH